MDTKYDGYMGKILLVDLTKQTSSQYAWSDRHRELFLGGKPMALKLLFDHLNGTESAFSEENWIIITTGPLTLSGAPSSSRYDIAAISPVSGLPETSNCGGDFGVYLKRAGYDALILSGRCDHPCLLEIRSDHINFRDASELWGSTTDACAQVLKSITDEKKFGSLSIGPAGENVVRFASVIDGTHTSGRTGIGGVLGWKNLKAITVAGSCEISIRDHEETAALKKQWFTELHTHPLTGKDSRSGTKTTSACPGCPILCRRQFNKGANAQTDQFNRLGMDSVSALDTVSWAFEAAENGLLSQPLPADTDELFEDIAYRRGIGNELANGVNYLSKHYGLKAPKGKKSAAAKHNRNEGYPALLQGWGIDPESLTPSQKLNCAMMYMDLCEAVSASGLCMFSVNALCPAELIRTPNRTKSRLIRRLIPRMHWAIERINRNPNMLLFPNSLFYQVRMLRSVTGMNLTPGAFLQIGQRTFALEQALLQKFGADTAKLPRMLKKDNLPSEDYFDLRGWDQQGNPSAQTLKKLKILP